MELRPCRFYAIVVDLKPENEEDLKSKLAGLQALVEFIQGQTVMEATIDDKYSDALPMSVDFPNELVTI